MQYLSILMILLLAVLLLLLLFICPSFKRRKDIKELSSFLFAHRGLHGGDIIENTLPAFQNAVDNNYGIELDVRLSEDRNVVVFHDDSTKRAFGIDKPIEAFAYYQILRFGLFGTKEKVPLFIETLNLVSGKVPLIVELKACAEWQVLCRKTAFLLDNYEGAFTVQSFDPLIVDWFKNHRPKYIRGLLMYPYKTGDYGIGAVDAFFTRNMFPNLIARPQYIAYDCNERNRFGLNLMTKFFKLPEVSWTVKSQEKLEECLNDKAIIIFEGFTPVIPIVTETAPLSDAIVTPSPEETQTEVVKEEPKEETKAEVIKEEPKVETKAEVVKEEPKVETKSEIVKEEPKVETKSEIAKEEPKVETKSEIAKEEPKEETKAEVAKEEPKVETKAEIDKEKPKVEPKAEVVKEEPQAEIIADVAQEEITQQESDISKKIKEFFQKTKEKILSLLPKKRIADEIETEDISETKISSEDYTAFFENTEEVKQEEKTAEVTPEKKTTEVVPEEKTVEVVPEEKTAEVTPEEKTAEVVPEEKTAEVKLEEKTK
ncbi:MAG: glycerophosphodiester phosphodiesterase family protein [Clostridia bacterium]